MTGPLAALATALVMETAAGEAWAGLGAAGIPAILLKGPAIAGWLYVGEVRVSRDIDLLVGPSDFLRAQEVLGRLGYAVPLAGASACEIGPNSQLLISEQDLCIDLHHHLIGVACGPERCWEVLSAHSVALELRSGVAVRALDLSARAMHLATHAAQSGPADAKALEDLRRGLARVPPSGWRAAAAVAADLGASAPFAAGLRLLGPGRDVAESLGLSSTTSIELELRITAAPQESLFFARLGEVGGTAAKTAVVARKVWPTAVYLRAYSPAASAGPWGVARARCGRAVSLARRSGPALVAWGQARARLRRGAGAHNG